MHKLAFSLKQHTPIIHFQYDQDGATLRATEVKPKLDRFIIEKFKERNLDYKKWLVGNGEHEALNYKMKLSYNGEMDFSLPLPTELNSRSYPNREDSLREYILSELSIGAEMLTSVAFFANADKLKFNGNSIDKAGTKLTELRFAVKAQTEISGMLLFIDNDLLTEVETYIKHFFLSNNFGTRQNKGFGSFTLSSINGKPSELYNSDLKECFSYKTHSLFDNNDICLKFVHDEYQLLKSGKNHPRYVKSKLFHHFIDQNIRWEKRYFKQHIDVNRILDKELFYDKESAPIDVETTTSRTYNSWHDTQTNEYKFVRALLGLAEQYEYLIFAAKNKDGVSEKLVNNDGRKFADRNRKYIISLAHIPKTPEQKIERFKSPIFFKIINRSVYLGFNNSYSSILDEQFSFKLKLKDDPTDTVSSLTNLHTPASFDLAVFLANALENNKWKIL